eukprot:2230056-Rhodomonas_salina.3
MLNLKAETGPTLHLQVNLAQLGISRQDVLPMLLTDYWLEQRSQDKPIPWIISHRLPRPQRTGRGSLQHSLHPTLPTGNSLWQVVNKIHSFDFQTDQYRVDMVTGSDSLPRWGTQAFDKLAGTLYRAPAQFVPSEGLQPEQGRWWKCTGHRKDTNQGQPTILFDGMWLPGGDTTAATFTQTQLTALILAAPTIPRTVTWKLTAEALGQPPEGKLFQNVHDYWMGELCRDCPVPVEIECCMPPDYLLSRTALQLGKRKTRQTELDTPSSSSRAQSPVPDSEIALWTPAIQRGTRLVPPVVCMTNDRPYTATEVQVDEQVFTLGRDSVYLEEGSRRLWSVKRAKYMQWQQRTGLDDRSLAQLGIAEHQRSVQAAARGARLPSWPYLQHIMASLGLDTVVGPSILEAPPNALWTTVSDNFTWAD